MDELDETELFDLLLPWFEYVRTMQPADLEVAAAVEEVDDGA